MTTSQMAPTSPAEVVARAAGLVAELDEVLWAARRPGELLDTVAALEALKSQVEAVELALACEVEASGAAAAEGWASAKDYLTEVAGARRGHGGAVLRLGHALERYPRLREALATGSLSLAQARVIVTSLEALPGDTGLRARGEAVMLEHAGTHNASELATIGGHLVEVVDPDGVERAAEAALERAERAAHQERFLAISPDGAGGARITGRASIEDAALIKATLAPLTAPQPGSTAAPTGPTADDASGTDSEGRDRRAYGTRLLDALVDACRRLQGVPEALPTEHGAGPRITVLLDYADLAARVGVATLETGEPLPASALRRMACDAEIIPIVLGGESEILDLGRTRRLVTAALWRALVARDRHCAFPGCRRPPAACHAHHIRHWAEGGGTSLANLVLLCAAHHQTIHHTPWQVRLDPADQQPEFVPPASLDPRRRPIRTRNARERPPRE